ncbi:MAG: hypothetical protein H6865_05140 [Rhodospirillales bacterium]|nr:hypothetical protein [Alphaproteobacteria bacterium]MCB9987003.1 hypothetical protein [Rhodospirillales bacterium]USO08224.1 MAG: hypothetical protein H6866_03150 [Rhodospirillales bacterium]
MEFKRLSDRVLYALQLSLEQNDLVVSERLARALEIALTRTPDGHRYVERRDFTTDYDAAMKTLDKLRMEQA